MDNHKVNYFGLTSFRNQKQKFGIKQDDRRRHFYTIGKTGMGKSNLMELPMLIRMERELKNY